MTNSPAAQGGAGDLLIHTIVMTQDDIRHARTSGLTLTLLRVRPPERTLRPYDRKQSFPWLEPCSNPYITSYVTL